MSEEEYYRDILDEEDESEKYKDYESQDSESEWDEEEPSHKEYYTPEPEEQRPYRQEYYGEGYYQDYEYGPPDDEGGPPWFWIGVLVAAGLSAVIMIIFNFVGTPNRPGLAYIELVLLLICTTLPGLFVRKVGKGILGGLMIFALQFFIPLIVFFASGKNPAAFYSPHFFFLNILGLLRMGFNDLFGFSFIPDLGEIQTYYNQYERYMAFVWLFDLLIMFGIVMALVIASSWLGSNLFTEKVKTFWTWCFLPFQVMVIITNLVIIPWFLLCTSSLFQMGGSLVAGFGNAYEGASVMIEGQGEMTNITQIDPGNITKYLDRADEWFKIAQSNYQGLNSLLYIKIMTAVAGRYGPVIEVFNHSIYAGFEVLAALKPLAHGVFDNSNETGVEVDGMFYQYEEIMGIVEEFEGMFSSLGENATKPTETQLTAAENDVAVIINDLDYLIQTFFMDAMTHILKADTIISRIEPDKLRNIGGRQEVEEVLNQAADMIENITEISNDYRLMMPFLVDVLDESPHLLRALLNVLIGNVRLFLGYQFATSQTYFSNSTVELGYIDSLFTPQRETELSESETALGLYYFFEDIVDLIMPIISEEEAIAGAFDNIILGLDEFVDEGTGECTLGTVNYGQMYDYMNSAVNHTDTAVFQGTEASSTLTQIETRGNNEEYAMLSPIAQNMTDMIGEYFQPQEYAQIFNHLTLAVNSTFGAVHQINLNNSVGVTSELTYAEGHIDDALTIVEADPESPVYALRDFLIQFQDGIVAIKEAVNDAGGNISSAIPYVEDILEDLYVQVHDIIDEGLPP